jgi:hypothetical protein
MSDKNKKNDETLTEQQKINCRKYVPEVWGIVCPHCKIFHRPKTPCGAIAAQIAERKRERGEA